MKRNRGITLIALVITIVVLIILAGVAISLSLGENGIFNKAKFATEEYANEQEKEGKEINELAIQIGDIVESTRDDVTEKMKAFKKRLATVITSKGVETSENDTEDAIISNIEKIPNMQRRETNEIPEGITNVKIIVVTSTNFVLDEPTFTGDIIVSTEETQLYSANVTNYYALVVSEYDIETNGQAGTIDISFSGGNKTRNNYYYIYY